jgi:hypothetical protein
VPDVAKRTVPDKSEKKLENLIPFKAGPDARRGKGPPKGQGGAPRKAFKNFLSEMRQDPRVQLAFETAATDPEHKNFAAALKLLADYDEEAPANLTADERKARVLALLKEADDRRKQA